MRYIADYLASAIVLSGELYYVVGSAVFMLASVALYVYVVTYLMMIISDAVRKVVVLGGRPVIYS